MFTHFNFFCTKTKRKKGGFLKEVRLSKKQCEPPFLLRLLNLHQTLAAMF